MGEIVWVTHGSNHKTMTNPKLCNLFRGMKAMIWVRANKIAPVFGARNHHVTAYIRGMVMRG